MNSKQISEYSGGSLGPETSEQQVRAVRQRALLRQGGKCLLTFTLNIPESNKCSPLAKKGIEEGIREIEIALDPRVILKQKRYETAAGYEADLLLDMPASEVKRRMVCLEDRHPIGDLFHLEVFENNGELCTRKKLGLPQRKRLPCSLPASDCTGNHTYASETSRRETACLLAGNFQKKWANQIAACATRALLYEVGTTPKPGLVDRNNSGSHIDMDIFTFFDSSAALTPWFQAFAELGLQWCDCPPHTVFLQARYIGERAERAMFAATGGVNTHKGLIFSLGLLCTAAGMLCGRGGTRDSETLTALCGQLAKGALDDFSELPQKGGLSHGERIYQTHRITGARGEAAAAFPSVRHYGLPALKKALRENFSINDAAVITLMTLIANVQDTNMIARSDIQTQEQVQREIKALLDTLDREHLNAQIARLDQAFIEKHLSPGGCADLLTITLMLHFWEECS